MKIGFHTDAFNSSYFSFEACLKWAQKNGVHYIECGLIDGVSWIHGLGYQPHVALYEDPVLLRKKMDGYGVRFSQVDAAYPALQQGRPAARRALRAERHPLGQADRLPLRGHHRRHAQARGP